MKLPCDHCVAFGVDNTNSNIGAKNSIKSRVTQVNPSIYFVGCPCHIIHNAAQKSAEAFRDVSGIDVEECCVDHYCWFDKSTKRKGQLDQYSTFCDTAYRGFIKHINVRWLSLQNAVERILQMFAASNSYFRSEVAEARFIRLRKLYEDPMFEIQLLFFQAVLPVFTTFNLFLQRDDPQIYILHSQMLNLLEKLLSKFIKPAVIQRHKEKLSEVAFNDPENQLDASKLFIGLVSRSEIRKKLEGGDITAHDVKKFYSSVIAFYASAVTHVLIWFPLDDAVVKDSEFVDFNKKEECDFSMVCTFIERYPKLLNVKDRELDKVCEEFLDYQAMSRDEIPKDIWDDAVCYEDSTGSTKVTHHRMDRIWSHISQIKLPGLDSARFAHLSPIAKLALTIPHSNAAEERVYSVIRKIRCDDRGKLQLEGTLSSLVTVNLNLPESKAKPCYAFQPSKTLLQQAKKATSYYNKEVCSSKDIAH